MCFFVSACCTSGTSAIQTNTSTILRTPLHRTRRADPYTCWSLTLTCLTILPTSHLPILSHSSYSALIKEAPPLFSSLFGKQANVFLSFKSRESDKNKEARHQLFADPLRSGPVDKISLFAFQAKQTHKSSENQCFSYVFHSYHACLNRNTFSHVIPSWFLTYQPWQRNPIANCDPNAKILSFTSFHSFPDLIIGVSRITITVSFTDMKQYVALNEPWVSLSLSLTPLKLQRSKTQHYRNVNLGTQHTVQCFHSFYSVPLLKLPRIFLYLAVGKSFDENTAIIC